MIHDQAIASERHSNVNGFAESFGLDHKLGEQGMKLFTAALAQAENNAIRRRVEKVSGTAVRLALEPVWLNAMEANFVANARKLPRNKFLKPVTPPQVARHRNLFQKLVRLTKTHNMHSPREGSLNPRIFKAISKYLQTFPQP